MTVRDAVLRALNSGWPVTLTAEESQEVYDALKAIRKSRLATPRCPCGAQEGEYHSPGCPEGSVP
jgi:hypothetical protein